MDITELTAKLPDKFKPWATTYGPAFLTMTAAEIQAIIIRIASGDIVAATPQFQAIGHISGTALRVIDHVPEDLSRFLRTIKKCLAVA